MPVSTAADALVVREDRDGLAILTLNRPARMNALSDALFADLATHVAAIEADTETVGCVLLHGAGPCFSVGHDLGELDPDAVEPGMSLAARTIAALAALPQPVIVAVHGHCYTGGLELALAGDVILAAESARFADTHAKWALTPIWGMSQRLPRRIGRARAHEMMLTCRPVPGAEAAAIGLANRCLPDANFAEAAIAYARGILANSWFSHRANKHLLLRTEAMPLAEGLAYEIEHNEGVGPDMQGRLAAFANRKR